MNAAQAYLDAYEFDVEAHNARIAYLRAIDKDTPAKVWWDAADHQHPAVARALRINPAEEGAFFALIPFRLAKIDGRHLILAAWPTPRCLGPVDMDHLGIEQVLAWNPVDNTAEVLGDPTPQLFGTFRDQTEGTLFADTRAFLTAWLQDRAAFFVRWCQSRRGAWAHGATETDLIPGALMVGSADKIRWRPSALPETLHCVGVEPATINRAVLRAARLPRAVGAAHRIAA